VNDEKQQTQAFSELLSQAWLAQSPTSLQVLRVLLTIFLEAHERHIQGRLGNRVCRSASG